MKKFFIAIVALAAAVACSNDDIISIDRQAIGFGNPFVENSTRAAIDPSYSGTTKSLTTFNVWGTVTGNSNTVNVFNGATCTGNVNMDVWSCDETEYWIPNCSYNFTAIVDHNSVGNDDNNMPTTITVTSDGTRDLLLATATATTDANGAPSQNPVAFTFAHLMSKAHFTFKNTVGSSNYAFQVTDVKVSNLYTKGVYTIGATTPWAVSAASTTPLEFGHAVYAEGKTSIENAQAATSNFARTLLPATYGNDNKFIVTFAAYMLYKGKNLGAKNYTIEATHTFAPNCAYNFVVELGAGDEIKFKVTEVNGWGEIPDIDIP